MFYRGRDGEAEALRREVEAVIRRVPHGEPFEGGMEIVRRYYVRCWPNAEAVRVECSVHHFKGFSTDPGVYGVFNPEWTVGLLHELAELLVHSGFLVSENCPIDVVTTLTVSRIV